jgi:hypothetical protein
MVLLVVRNMLVGFVVLLVLVVVLVVFSMKH